MLLKASAITSTSMFHCSHIKDAQVRLYTFNTWSSVGCFSYPSTRIVSSRSRASVEPRLDNCRNLQEILPLLRYKCCQTFVTPGGDRCFVIKLRDNVEGTCETRILRFYASYTCSYTCSYTRCSRNEDITFDFNSQRASHRFSVIDFMILIRFC
jgi:hypothetical protein